MVNSGMDRGEIQGMSNGQSNNPFSGRGTCKSVIISGMINGGPGGLRPL